MAKAKKTAKQPKTYKHIVTQEDLDNNPGLAEQGVKVGDEVDVPEENEKGYFVKEGKSFRDKNDFSKEYVAGEDVSHLEADRIEHLVTIGYVEEK